MQRGKLLLLRESQLLQVKALTVGKSRSRVRHSSWGFMPWTV
jgi:hypothetical protein